MSDEFRRYSQKRQIVDYNKIVGEFGQGQVICIDRGVLSIVRQLLVSRGLWRSTYATAFSSGVYYIPDSDEFRVVGEHISEFLAETDTMATCEDLQGLLEGLTTVITSGGLGGGCCADGSGGQSPDTPYSTFEDGGDNYPDEYGSREAYDSAKCNASQWFINAWIQDLSFVSTLNFATATAGSLAIALLIPGINVGIAIGIILAIVASGLLAEVTSNIGDWIGDNSEDILCIIYNAGTAENAVVVIKAAIETSSLTSLEQALAKAWVTPAALNKAFEYSNVTIVGADCTACDPCPPVVMYSGSWDEGIRFTSATEPTYGHQHLSFIFEATSSATEDRCHNVTIDAFDIVSGTPAGGGGWYAYEWYDKDWVNVWLSNSLPTLPFGPVSHIIVRDAASPYNPVIVDVDWTVIYD